MSPAADAGPEIAQHALTDGQMMMAFVFVGGAISGRLLVRIRQRKEGRRH